MASSSLQPYVAEFFGDCSDAVGVHLKYFLVIIFITVKKYILKSTHSFSFQFFVCIVKKSVLQRKKLTWGSCLTCRIWRRWHIFLWWNSWRFTTPWEAWPKCFRRVLKFWKLDFDVEFSFVYIPSRHQVRSVFSCRSWKTQLQYADATHLIVSAGPILILL